MSIDIAPVRAHAVTRPVAGPATGSGGRRWHLPRLWVLCAVSAAVLAPWAVYLAASLPASYLTANWNVAWVGFDALLMLLLGVTALLARRGHALQAPFAFATAALLVADAWFDMTTATGTNLMVSVASALLVELPLAGYLVRRTVAISAG